MDRLRVTGSLAVAIFAALLLPSSARAQDDRETKGVNSGDYNIQQSIEFGYRTNEINGNKDTYDTFINLRLRSAPIRLLARYALPEPSGPSLR